MDDLVVTHLDVYQSWQKHLFNFNNDDPKMNAPGLRFMQSWGIWWLIPLRPPQKSRGL